MSKKPQYKRKRLVCALLIWAVTFCLLFFLLPLLYHINAFFGMTYSGTFRLWDKWISLTLGPAVIALQYYFW